MRLSPEHRLRTNLNCYKHDGINIINFHNVSQSHVYGESNGLKIRKVYLQVLLPLIYLFLWTSGFFPLKNEDNELKGIKLFCSSSLSTRVLGFPRGAVVKNPLTNLEEARDVWPLGCEDPLEKEMTTHSSILVWKIPWTEEPGGLQSMGSSRVRHGWVLMHTHRSVKCN